MSDLPGNAEEPAELERSRNRRGAPSATQVREEISREMLKIHEKSFGKGTGEIHAFVEDGWVIVLLDDPHLLPNEHFLIEAGHQDTVVEVRHQYEHAIQASFRAAIERATGRTVVGFTSTTRMDQPRFVAEIFKLE
ncbi:MAG TPA: Na-translocating system protein MpsC family protein [Solirubrobacterales bacterium]